VAERGHWDAVYERWATTDVSWFQREPIRSLELIATTGAAAEDPIIDVGGGASTLVDRLLDGGHTDVTVLDIADSALAASRSRLGSAGDQVRWVVADVLTWQPNRQYLVWHDRAVFHFLTDQADREGYRQVLNAALAPGGSVVVGTFAADGPTSCSGLPAARYASGELAEQFPDLDVMTAVREEHVTPAGRVQPFTWLLLRRHD
jgi:trans-aconitate methyltransferase